ncbi:MAG: 5'-methylthioadenosine/adenosylhomocysteine nucleosidase [Clostridia bacterium]|nr:5'-methylthioadenosine/adenosylhomocysteine nucleosidase [Clostridia bacterium]MBQ8370833.1 5'-methylthioadenosine/adenosylhomocysteine nucleosidase [Clostridia bacterium]MBQ8513075.1 5'-methylthioadenosine/adenosylhomocysteine nucleosidase [Clostridia bacterium]
MKLGIIAAMTIEAEAIIAAMTDAKTEECGSITFTVGKIGGCDVVCAVCGIGKVFAAMCAQTMIVKYAPDYVVNTGVGGTLTRELSIGDMAVSLDCVQHDMDTSALGDPVGLISGINIVKIPASAELAEKICAIAAENGIRTHCGTIASGDRFVADSAVKKYITETFGGIACEMEGAAVGQVCYVNKIPFAVIRAISDDADGGACEDYPSFAKASAQKSAKTVIALAERL